MSRRWWWGLGSLRAGIGWLALFSLVPAALVVGWTYHRDAAQAEAAAFDRARLLANGAAQALEFEIGGLRTAMQSIAARHELRSLDAPGCRSLLADVGGLRPALTTLTLRHIDGSPACSALQPPPPASAIVSTPWFQAALASEGFRAGDAFRGPITGRWTVPLTMPVRGETGTVAGVLTLSLDLESLAGRLFERLPAGSLVAVIGADHRLLLRSRLQQERVGQPVPERFSQRLATRQPATFEDTGVDGVRRFYATLPVHGTGWQVVGALEVDRALAAAADERRVTLLLVALGLAAAFSLGVVMLRRVLSPIRALAGAASAVAAGQADARAAVRGPAELRQLAETFNTMLDVRQRTERALAESETRFRTLSALSSDWYWEQDAQFRFVSISDSVADHVPLTSDEHIGRTRWELPWVDMTDAEWGAHRARLLRHEPFHDFELRRPGADGQVCHVLLSGVPLFDAQGRFTGYRGVGRDVTAERRAQQALAQRERRFRELIDHLPVGVVVHAPDTSVQLFNPEACRVLGLTPGQMEGRQAPDPAWHFVDDAGRPMPLEDYPVSRVLATRAPVNGQIGGIDHGDGGPRVWVLANAFPEFDDAGKVESVIVVFVDITLQRQADELRRAREQAESASRAKSEFLSRMSHELRTPLNAVLGFSEVLQTDPTVRTLPGALRQLALIHQSGSHLLALVNDLLDIARIENHALEVERQPIAVAPLLDELVALHAPAAAGSEITVQVLAGDAATRLLGDPRRLRQVLNNLIGNAVKYNRRAGVVSLHASTEDDQVAIDIADTGLGLDEDQQAALFQPFNRLGAERLGIEGTGLGLVIARQLVEAMGGTLVVRSERGRGSVFTVRLPRAGDASPPADGGEASAATSTAGPLARRVLCIEDHAANRELLAAALAQRPGLEVVFAASGEEGLHRAREIRPDLVLLDIGLPDIDGLEVLRRLRAQPDGARVPCIAVSAGATASDVARVLAAGCDDYVSKPFRVGELLRAIERTIG